MLNSSYRLIFDCCYKISYNKKICICDKISLLQKCTRVYLRQLNTLPEITYNNTLITYSSINSFVLSSKNNNDKNNKMRENIIGAFINGYVSNEYILYSNRWRIMKHSIMEYIHSLMKSVNNMDTINTMKLIHRGGRKYNYDFTILINDTYDFNIELKYNASTVKETPQFISPMKPSQYMSASYEEYFYDIYLPKLAEMSGLNIPLKETYLSEIHSFDPSCMLEYQELYYKGCKQSSKFTRNPNDIAFYEYAKKIDNESRKTFIESTDLNIELLSSYLQETQHNKIYMLYKKNKFYKEDINLKDYRLVSYEKRPSKYMYIAKSESNRDIKILLRWKNGNGIAYPAFQIS